MLFILFPQESLFRKAGNFIYSFVPLIKINCSLHNIKHLTTLNNNYSTESELEQCLETVHVFICETKWVQFL